MDEMTFLKRFMWSVSLSRGAAAPITAVAPPLCPTLIRSADEVNCSALTSDP